MRARLQKALVLGARAALAVGLLLALLRLAPAGSSGLVACYGASITLLLGAPDSPLGTPYRALLGGLVAALAGVAAWKLLGTVSPAAACVVAVSGAVVAMALLDALHPPGGAAALIAVLGGEAIHELGWAYALHPITTGTAALLALRWTLVRATRRGPQNA